jgi:two-component system, LuxR family, response regulator FixJ
VLAGLANSFPNRRIAEHLGISPRTVEIHRSHVMQKLKAKHSADAIRIAIDADLKVYEMDLNSAARVLT